MNSMISACESRDLKAIKNLCRKGKWEHLFKTDPDLLCSPFQLCCINGYSDIVIFLLTQISFPISSCWLRFSIHNPSSFGFCGYSPLHLFCHHGNLSVVQILCDKGAVDDILKEDCHHHRSPLISACIADNLSLCHFLVSKVKQVFGDDKLKEYLNLRDLEGNTASYYACRTGNIDILQLLCSSGSDYENSLLFISTNNSHANIVKYLLRKNTSVSKRLIKARFDKCCFIGRLPTFMVLCDFFVNILQDRKYLFDTGVLIIIQGKHYKLLRWLFKTYSYIGDAYVKIYLSPIFFQALTIGDILTINVLLSVFDDVQLKSPHYMFKEYFADISIHYVNQYFILCRSIEKLVELGLCIDGKRIDEAYPSRKMTNFGRFGRIDDDHLTLYRHISMRIKRSRVFYQRILEKLHLPIIILHSIADFSDLSYGESFTNLTLFVNYFKSFYYLPIREMILHDEYLKMQIREHGERIIQRLCDMKKKYKWVQPAVERVLRPRLN